MLLIYYIYFFFKIQFIYYFECIKINYFYVKLKKFLFFKFMDSIKIINNVKKKSNLVFSDYLNLLFKDFQEFRGDRFFYDDRSIIGGIAKLDNLSVMIVGQQKGKTQIEKDVCNYGMTSPFGYRKALRLFKLAEKFQLPIITFIDTPGALPSLDAEKNGQNISIASNLKEMFLIKTSILSFIIGEGCSGGALAISVCDKLFMNEISYFSVINPDGCASILSFKGDIKCLIDVMNITPKKLIRLKLIDDIIKKQTSKFKLKEEIKFKFKDCIEKLNNLSIKSLLKNREKKFEKFGIL